ncbi:hypothetical protein Dsin_005866 [Dipteronia sinensis]|uniref:RNase H type-1 domain-containing protein n=1 Tax=Dipteronia sinensis TaxID=43782 RepID=A0AAE0AYL0_9ROSI|nr:hypothetical protein Dsin_005866 [Dipteronia sinensis]
MQKSNITFSLNVSDSLKKEIIELFDLKDMGNKTKTFNENEIRERVWKTVSYWKDWLFSTGWEKRLLLMLFTGAKGEFYLGGFCVLEHTKAFERTLKLNSDAAVIPCLDFVGIGVVVRDSASGVFYALSKPFTSDFSVECAEVTAFREGLIMAKQLELNIAWVGVDAANVAACVNLFKPLCRIAWVVFDDVQALCKDAGISKCHAISRKGDSLAHNLTPP